MCRIMRQKQRTRQQKLKFFPSIPRWKRMLGKQIPHGESQQNGQKYDFRSLQPHRFNIKQSKMVHQWWRLIKCGNRSSSKCRCSKRENANVNRILGYMSTKYLYSKCGLSNTVSVNRIHISFSWRIVLDLVMQMKPAISIKSKESPSLTGFQAPQTLILLNTFRLIQRQACSTNMHQRESL